MKTKIRLAQLIRVLWAAALVLPAFGAQAGVSLTTFHSFGGTTNGGYPAAGLVHGSDGYFYGTTSGFGGNVTGSDGTVFKISTNGALTTLYSFTGGDDGADPEAGLVEGSDGYFYGTTEYGGAYTDQFGNGYGTVFQISTNGALTSLYSFGSIQDANGLPLDGVGPNGLVQGSDGYFYGTTAGLHGGFIVSDGTVFKISTNGALTTLYSFNSRNDGWWPVAGLVQSSDGYFYGTTEHGGTNDYGTVFRISTNGALTSLYSFGTIRDIYGNPLNGSYPMAGLVQGRDGYFYGTTLYGGTTNYNAWFVHGYGTVFKISTNGGLTTLYSFTGTNDGAYPYAALVQSSDGYFYGTTANGGTTNSIYFNESGYGTVFKISTNGAQTTLYAFGSMSNSSGWALDGANPNAALVQSSDGYFYGTTVGGGTNNIGTVFKISTNGALTTLYSFGTTRDIYGNPLDGGGPMAGLVQGSDGSFYGTTSHGGQGGGGTVFVLALNTTMSIPALTWTNPAAITYGTALSSSQLNATANVPGRFAYAPTTDTVLDAGTNTLSVIFTPTEAVDYNSATTSVSLVVLPAPLTVTAANTNRLYGQANPVFTGTLTGVTNGDNIAAAYGCSAATNSPAATYAIVPSPVDPNGRLVNYAAVTNNGAFTVLPAAPLLTWTNPAAITYGTPLSSSQLNATANVLGTFAYNPTNGAVLNADTNILTAVFTPTDAVDYNSATDSVSLVVLPAAIPPVIQAVGQSGGSLTLTWVTAPGQMYQIQYLTDLSQTNWAALGSAVTATNSSLTASDATTNLQRFYRVIWMP